MVARRQEFQLLPCRWQHCSMTALDAWMVMLPTQQAEAVTGAKQRRATLSCAVSLSRPGSRALEAIHGGARGQRRLESHGGSTTPLRNALRDVLRDRQRCETRQRVVVCATALSIQHGSLSVKFEHLTAFESPTRRCSVVVITPDSESGDPSSTLGTASFVSASGRSHRPRGPASGGCAAPSSFPAALRPCCYSSHGGRCLFGLRRKATSLNC